MRKKIHFAAASLFAVAATASVLGLAMAEPDETVVASSGAGCSPVVCLLTFF
ncbi:MAG: hypothetical protein AAGA09_05070 [Pseudomonadota bacterium]